MGENTKMRAEFDAWWADFAGAHEEWPFADSGSLRWAAYQAGRAAAAPAAHVEAEEMPDADYKEGEPGWRPSCCTRSGDGPCCDIGYCDIGYCAADKERADIQSGK